MSASDASEKELRYAESSDNQLAHDSHSPGKQSENNPNQVDPIQAESSPFTGPPANPARLTKEEREIKIREHARETNATLEYDEDGQLQPVYPHLQSEFFDDKPSSALWRHRTTFVRDISANLDQARSSDLSIHLYNTFKIRQRAKAQTPDENGFVETKEPPRAWAAWPLTRDFVPRDHQQRQREDDDWRIGPYLERKPRPADELKELLIARATKTGKERFLARESEGSSDGGEADEGLRPVVSTDDEAIERVLRPSIHHLLERLDTLLVALHHARSPYIAPLRPERKKLSPKSRLSHTEAYTNSEQRGTLRTSDDADSNESSSFEDEMSESETPGPQMTQNGIAGTDTVNSRTHFLQQKARTAGLRDWTDIFSVASMTGVGPAVISRLASRCDDIFDSDKEFREIYGGLTNQEENAYLPYGGSSKHTERSKSQDGEIHGNVHVDGFMQTIPYNSYWKSLSKQRDKLKAAEAEMVVEASDENVSDNEIEDEDEDESDDDEEPDEEPDDSGELGDVGVKLEDDSNKFDDLSVDEEVSDEYVEDKY